MSGPRQEPCDRCDGCGWYEGGKTLKTTCEKCGGTGILNATAEGRMIDPGAGYSGYDEAMLHGGEPDDEMPNNVVACVNCKRPVEVTALNAIRCPECQVRAVAPARAGPAAEARPGVNVSGEQAPGDACGGQLASQ